MRCIGFIILLETCHKIKCGRCSFKLSTKVFACKSYLHFFRGLIKLSVLQRSVEATVQILGPHPSSLTVLIRSGPLYGANVSLALLCLVGQKHSNTDVNTRLMMSKNSSKTMSYWQHKRNMNINETALPRNPVKELSEALKFNAGVLIG